MNRVVCILSVSWCERVREQGRRTKHEQQHNHVWPSHSHKSNVLRLPQQNNNCSYFCLENYDSNPELASDIRQLSCTCSAIENGARLQGVICRIGRLPLLTEKYNVQSCEGLCTRKSLTSSRALTSHPASMSIRTISGLPWDATWMGQLSCYNRTTNFCNETNSKRIQNHVNLKA